MRELTCFENILFRTGAIVFVIGLGIHLFYPLVGTLLFSVGVLAFTTMQMKARYEGTDFLITRLRRQQLLSDIFFLLSACAMVAQEFNFGPSWTHRNIWTLLLIIGCVFQLYTAFRLPSELERNACQHGGRLTTLLLLASPFLMDSCSTPYNVEGTTNVSMLEGKTLSLKIFKNDDFVAIDSCKVQHGHINFCGALDSVEMVNIFVEDESMMPMVLEQGDIKLTINEMEQKVTGTALNDTLYAFIQKKVKLDAEMANLSHLESKLIMDGYEEADRNRILYDESSRIGSEIDHLVTSFIIKNSDNVLGPGVFMILTSAYPFPQTTPQIDEIMFRAKPFFKNSPYVKSYMKAAKENMEKMQ